MIQVAARPGHKLGSLSIPNDRVGRLIGPKGSVINKIRDDTGSFLPLLCYTLCLKDPAWRF